ncbi:MAG TPA: methyltransferase [Gemmataceae bacterium]|nr:methyltransferase [Gemmataceae bacterium]
MSIADRTDLPPEKAETFVGPTIREKVLIEEHTFLIERPDEVERIPNHHSLRATFAEGEYVPYWTDLWPASRMLAKAVLREPWPPGIEALEVGCGLGLPGVAALARGLRVIFSDYDPAALEFATRNARLNKFEQFRVLRLDWNAPPDDLRVPVVLASDLLYELRNVEPLVALVKRVLLPDGLCLLTDQDRVPSHTLRQTLEREGFDFMTQIMRAGQPGGRRFKGTLYRITKRHS